MKKIAAATFGLALMGLSPANAHAEGVVTASVDCATFSVTVTGYPDGSNVYLGVGSQPPTSFVTDGDSAHWVGVGLYESTHTFEAIVDIGETRVFDEYVDCTPPAGVTPGSTVPLPAIADAVTPSELDLSTWAGVELAPPW